MLISWGCWCKWRGWWCVVCVVCVASAIHLKSTEEERGVSVWRTSMILHFWISNYPFKTCCTEMWLPHIGISGRFFYVRSWLTFPCAVVVVVVVVAQLFAGIWRRWRGRSGRASEEACPILPCCTTTRRTSPMTAVGQPIVARFVSHFLILCILLSRGANHELEPFYIDEPVTCFRCIAFLTSLWQSVMRCLLVFDLVSSHSWLYT